MNTTSIEWTATQLPDGTRVPGFTANPIKYRDKATGRDVWACAKTSPGCKNCYAEAIAERFGRGGPFNLATIQKVEPYVCDKEVKTLLKSKKLKGRKVFLGDMTDVFGEWIPDEMLDRLFAVFALRPDVTWQVLTKRADRMRRYLSAVDLPKRLGRAVCVQIHGEKATSEGYWVAGTGPHSAATLPLRNVWVGYSAENQECFDRRSTQMAPVMRAGWTVFVSAEPLLGPIRMMGWDGTVLRNWLTGPDGPGVSWVVAGGESGHDARPMHPEWARSLRDQCRTSGVPFFFKQWGEWVANLDGDRAALPDGRNVPNVEPNGTNGDGAVRIARAGKKAAGRTLDGRTWDEFPEVASS